MKDLLGQEITEGDYVAGLFPENETPDIFTVTGFTPKKCRLWALSNPEKQLLKFGYDLIKIDPNAVREMINLVPRDALGQELKVGDYVFGSNGSYIDPIIFEITEFVPRKALVIKRYGSWCRNDSARYLTDLIKVNPAQVTMHCLTKENL